MLGRERAHTGSTDLLGIQIRGGGEGGLRDRVVERPVRVDVRGEADGLNAIPVGATGSAETPAHFSTQAADLPQSPLLCLSQCSACGQQSSAAATDASCATVRALAAAAGSMATERAVKATIMARAMLIVLQD